MNQIESKTYLERSAEMALATLDSDLSRIRELHIAFHAAAINIKEGTIEGANTSREIGLLLQSACGHEAMTFGFWMRHCNGKLPFDFEAAKFFMSVARKMKRKAESLSDASEFVQMILIADKQVEVPKRIQAHFASEISVDQKFYNELTKLRELYERVEQDGPMERWDTNRLDEFIEEMEFPYQLCEKARRIRAAK